MEKKVRLIDFFDYPEELFDGISELVIERFDFYDDLEISEALFNDITKKTQQEIHPNEPQIELVKPVEVEVAQTLW